MKKDKRSLALMARVGFSVLFLSLLVVPGHTFTTGGRVAAQTQQLTVSDFLNLLAPNAITVWTDPATGNTLAFDMYGKRNNLLNLNLGTTVKGTVTLKNLGDGTQRLTVNLHTKNAVCWGFDSNFQPAFGYSPINVASHVGPASLGDGLLRFDYAPQPVGPINVHGILDSIVTTIMCDGQLRSGSGSPDGSEGFAQTTQTALFNTGTPGGCPPEKDADCFPAEKIQFKPAGN